MKNKILVSIGSYNARDNNSIIFIHMWSRFIAKYKNQLPCDFLFVNVRFSPKLFNAVASPTPILIVKTTDYQVCNVFDTHSSYHSIAHNHNDYEYIIRVDSDAFPSFKFFKEISDFVTNNPEIDFISASNFCRTIAHNNKIPIFLDNGGVNDDAKRDFEWVPWGYPTYNGDLFVMKTEFFRKALANYRMNPKLAGQKCPFASNELTYKEVCDVMNYTETRFTQGMDYRPTIDGALGTDFWTYMCTSGMKMAGIVNEHGESFNKANYLLQSNNGKEFEKYEDIRDDVDRSYKHEKNVIAPYFHLGNAYLCDDYFDGFGGPEKYANAQNTIPHFTAEYFGPYVDQYAMIEHITKLSGNQHLVNKLTSNMDRFFTDHNIDKEKIRTYCDEVVEFFKSAIVDYV